jgi:putative modified peptide
MSFKLPEVVADRLLEKLGNDDAFRSAFVADARSALVLLGFAPAADEALSKGLWSCITVDRLASKEAIRAGRDALLRQLTVHAATFNPISLGIRASGERNAA